MAPEPSQDKLDLILWEIWESRLAIEQKIGALTTEVFLIKDEHRKLVDSVKSSEVKLAILELASRSRDVELKKITQQMELLRERAEDSEGQSCRNNFRIQGLPEGAEGQAPTQ
ncbi:hypothetical protein NDU88_001374 [Pleurodeles waltl]|uniref:Uncharacterized protein n=1 Tax=Pleurodeles waltl TaxID=8319 RepID=A0AAV7UWM2_PLEWA|nr:hypothetical protein NDU88_001374 [Pleurodeles waltl]